MRSGGALVGGALYARLVRERRAVAVQTQAACQSSPKLCFERGELHSTYLGAAPRYVMAREDKHSAAGGAGARWLFVYASLVEESLLLEVHTSAARAGALLHRHLPVSSDPANATLRSTRRSVAVHRYAARHGGDDAAFVFVGSEGARASRPPDEREQRLLDAEAARWERVERDAALARAAQARQEAERARQEAAEEEQRRRTAKRQSVIECLLCSCLPMCSLPPPDRPYCGDDHTHNNGGLMAMNIAVAAMY